MDSEVESAQQERNVKDKETSGDERRLFYRIRFRDDGQEFTGGTKLKNLKKGDSIMIKTDHGLEPASISGLAPVCLDEEFFARKVSYEIFRRPTPEEERRFENLPVHEHAAFDTCVGLIAKHQLVMNLIRVEKFFNGSKMIFYFTAENRVDFRALVKDLIQEFRTRVEMRQVGVRHETKMLGGLGTCGRVLCCSSFLKKFDSVSIKMAKEQDLPLNPTKISGVCNRLLCCLTYEYETYRRQRRKLPKLGRKIKVDDQVFRVKRQNPLWQSIVVSKADGEEKLLQKEEWQGFERLKGEKKIRKKRNEIPKQEQTE